MKPSLFFLFALSVSCFGIVSVQGDKWKEPDGAIGAHIALGAIPGEMLVSWFVKDPPTEGETSKCLGGVKYHGRTADCVDKAVFKGCAFTCVMKDLTPLQTCKYEIVTQSKSGAIKKEFSFVMPNGAQYSAETTLFAYGDMGTWDPAPQVANHLAEAISAQRLRKRPTETASVILHAGDLAYAEDKGKVKQKKWTTFGALVEGAAAQAPYMAARGNHDDKESLEIRWPMPGMSNQFYSFDNGPFHIIVLDMYSGYTKGTTQWEWLTYDLDRARRGANGFDPFIIVVNHQPMYDTSAGHTGGNENFREMESLLVRYRVNLLIAGDDHNYERTFPMVNHKVAATINDGSPNRPYTANDGLVHILAGTAGATIDDYIPGDPPKWSAHRERENGFLRLRGAGDDKGITVTVEFVISSSTGTRVGDTVHLRQSPMRKSQGVGSTPAGVFLVILISLIVIYGLLKFTGLNGRRQARTYNRVNAHEV